MLESVLIANRGEIARRIIRTCRRLGVRTIAVYSDADRAMPHVREADDAIRIGPAAARESYLSIERVIDAAERSGAAAVHPGYGFLSESPDFARAVQNDGLVFIGPSPEAMLKMGSKDSAKAVMERAAVPLVPGYHGGEQSPDRLRGEAERVGFPLLIKAAAGGGGRGMRLVSRAEEFEDALAACKREAMNAFGQDRVLLERYVERPRHVEVQVFADRFGNVVHLYERDCTLQRRHQKIIEEAPAPGVPMELRFQLGDAAVAAARATGYENAGTVEFLLERDGRFYFIEMNTRLQVEHPVTEAVTGQDLVEWQLRIASGERLPLKQEQIPLQGHAIEARLYAEDPAHDFLPSTGRVRRLRFPERASVRIDSGVEEGAEIGPHYDPMIAKIIARGASRERALSVMADALDATQVEGVVTNLTFLRTLARSIPYQSMRIDTSWLDREGGELAQRTDETVALDYVLGACALASLRAEEEAQRAAASDDPHTPWAAASGWRLNGPATRVIRFVEDAHPLAVTIEGEGEVLRVGIGEEREGLLFGHDGARYWAEVSGRRLSFDAYIDAGRLRIVRNGRQVALAIDESDGALAAEQASDALLRAPMPGRVTRLMVAEGDRVTAGQALAVLEAMKMEHRFLAPADGMITNLRVREGDQVDGGDALLDLESEPAETSA